MDTISLKFSKWYDRMQTIPLAFAHSMEDLNFAFVLQAFPGSSGPLSPAGLEEGDGVAASSAGPLWSRCGAGRGSTRRFRVEHSALSTRARSQASSFPLSVSVPSPTASSSGASRGLTVIWAHPMPGRRFAAAVSRRRLLNSCQEISLAGTGAGKLTSYGFRHKQGTASLNWTGWEVLLPWLCVCLSPDLH
ncbi:hypothetical protein T4D_14651 [Trichinella pseudospiralis]|uniref:Uncharacterized protein n=1 Tax=Trichinella pseudospiralis TaxID=6337 RepID=A0A0V1G2P3_TRIPS|nr:hypothetical protein T4D_14651 [Trichinella pseudospiralis]